MKVQVYETQYKYCIAAKKRNPELFEAKLNTIYMDSYREMNRLQELYDGQTRHGLNKEIQARWNQIITQALAGNWAILDEMLLEEK